MGALKGQKLNTASKASSKRINELIYEISQVLPVDNTNDLSRFFDFFESSSDVIHSFSRSSLLPKSFPKR
jgi:hypothetical protein